MLDKDPSGAPFFTLIWIILLAMLGGLVRFIQKFNERTERLPLLQVALKLGGELIISGFTGLAVFYLCQYWGLSNSLTAFIVAISGHMGGRAIEKLEKVYEGFFKVKK